MSVMHSEWKGRLRHWIRTLKEDFYSPLGEILWQACPAEGRLSPQEAARKDFYRVEPGFTWGKSYEYCWFRAVIEVPERAAGERIVLNLEPGGESTLFVNGKAFGTYRADWIQEKHHYFVDNTLTNPAVGGACFEVMMETYAGNYYPECVDGGCATGPVLPGAFTDPLEEGERRRLGICTYGIWKEEAYQLYMDVSTLEKLLFTLEETSLRAAHIAEALEQFTLAVDFEQDRAGRMADYRKARELLKPALQAVNGSTMPVFYGVGNAHLDLAWLWPMEETFRKTARTFAAQLRLIEEYPEYKFIQSQPAVYEMCREYAPELFERIRAAVKKGQWIADGAMWVEPDTNMAGGEALIRQLLYGKKYYREMFGTDSRLLWLPDTFGYSAALPQILKGCQVDYLVTQKIFWSYNEGERFPYHYFNWEGMDGSKIVSFLPTDYTYRTDPEEINRIWKNRSQTRNLEAFLLPFGYGDGGGGPTRDHVEYAFRQKDLEGSAKVKLAGPMEFFEEMETAGGPVDTWTGELYFTAHRGTYTSQAMVKKNNRRCENALREAELWSTLAVQRGNDYPEEKLERLWKELLVLQFHDILPGSGIGRIYEDAKPVFSHILEECEKLTQRAQEKLLEKRKGLTVFNGLGFPVKRLIALPEEFEKGAVTAEGETVPVAGKGDRVKALVSLPPCGAVTLLPCQNIPTKMPFAVHLTENENGFCLENGQVCVVVDKKGEISSYRLKESGREFAAAPMNHLMLYQDVARRFDAWDIDSNYRVLEQPGAFAVSVQPLYVSELEGILMVSGKIGVSSYTQQIRLTAESRRVEIEMEIDWKELHRLLKVAFPTEVYAEEGINEIQFGYVKRPARRSRMYEKERFEVCNHRYSALCDGSHGAAVLNDSKYGISMNENNLELSLLKAASSPQMRADNGIHRFTYAFTAWEGSFAEADVHRQAWELNAPPSIMQGFTNSFSAFFVNRENIMLESVKCAQDGSGDWILRLYEAKKASGMTEVKMPALVGCRAYLCDMLENKTEEIPVEENKISLFFRAFEIKTVRISQNN